MRVGQMVLAVLWSAVLPGCFIQPYDWQTVGYDQYFPVSGYTDRPNSTVSIEVRNHTTHNWDVIGTAQSAPSPSYSAGWFSSNSPNLYWWNTSVRVVDPAVVATRDRWLYGLNTTLRVRNTTSGTMLYGGDEDSVGCFFSNIAPAEDFYEVSYECDFDHTEVTIMSGLMP